MTGPQLPPLAAEDYICDACELAYSEITIDQAVEVICGLAAAVRAAVSAIPPGARRQRPDPQVWSVTEYVCHLRDVYLTYTVRLHRTRTENQPTLEPMLNDLRARRFRYNDRDVAAVMDELASTTAGFCEEITRTAREDWDRTATRLPGEHRTARWLVRQAMHEGVHHLADIRQVGERVRAAEESTQPDPTMLYRIRDGIYAGDLLITAVADLDLFTWLEQRGPLRASALGDELGLAQRPADVLLTYCAALGLIGRDIGGGDRIELTEMARRHLVAGSPYDLRSYYESLSERPAVVELGRVLRTGEPAAWASAHATERKPTPVADADWSSRLGDAHFASSTTAAMDARAAFLSPALARAVKYLPVRNLLDIGGSSGAYAAAIIEGRPDTRAAVFERKPVDEAARTVLRERGLADRISVITGDMFIDPLPDGYDTHLYSHVLHDWDDERVEHLLAASFAALPAGGWLLDHDTHIDADKRGPLPVAEYSVLLMHSTPGKCWSTAELAEIATKVGFVDVTQRPTAGDRSILLARKPA